MAARTVGSSRICKAPAIAIDKNQTTMIGPNIAATLAVPRLCAANNPIRMMTVSGATNSPNAGLASFSPSTADSTEIAGVITESPRNMEAPITPRMKTNAVRLPSARVASAVSESVPPSPLLSARSRMRTYLRVTVMMSAQTMSESTPSTMPRVTTWFVLAAIAASRKA